MRTWCIFFCFFSLALTYKKNRDWWSAVQRESREWRFFSPPPFLSGRIGLLEVHLLLVVYFVCVCVWNNFTFVCILSVVFEMSSNGMRFADHLLLHLVVFSFFFFFFFRDKKKKKEKGGGIGQQRQKNNNTLDAAQRYENLWRVVVFSCCGLFSLLLSAREKKKKKKRPQKVPVSCVCVCVDVVTVRWAVRSAS